LFIIGLDLTKDKKSFSSNYGMARTCTKCKNEIPDNETLETIQSIYPCCNKCWEQWKEYRIMVMNEMRLDMSQPDHRKLLKKNEKIFAGVLTPEGDIVDYSDEKNRNPEEKP
jgi:Fe-S cluster biosynthesis and repair protein YggX